MLATKEVKGEGNVRGIGVGRTGGSGGVCIDGGGSVGSGIVGGGSCDGSVDHGEWW